MLQYTHMAHDASLIDSREIARDTLLLQVERPDGFSFKAGQSIDLEIKEPPETDDLGTVRTFTIASAPHETELAIVSRLRDTAYKRSLRRLKPGAELSIDGPFGDMTLHSRSERPAVMLAGGIGVTPFRSMIMHATHEKLPHEITLFYSCRRPADAAFLEELTEVADEGDRISLVPTMTKTTKADEWDGLTRRIDADMLQGTLESIHEPIYYIAGPPAFVTAMQELLEELGVEEDDVRFEEFAGY